MDLIRVIILVFFLIMFAPMMIELWVVSKLDRLDTGFPNLTPAIIREEKEDFGTHAQETIFKERLGGLA